MRPFLGRRRVHAGMHARVVGHFKGAVFQDTRELLRQEAVAQEVLMGGTEGAGARSVRAEQGSVRG